MSSTPSRPRPVRVVIGAGGTGGHIYPGLAVADAIRRIRPDASVSFSGTPRGLEGRLVPAAGYPLDLVPMPPLDGRSTRSLVAFPGRAAASVVLAARRLRAERVDVVVGMGGYPSVPAVVAARILGVPALIHESNAVPGRANAAVARLTRNIATGFDPGEARWCRGRGRDTRHVGFPLPQSMAAADPAACRDEARARFGVAAGQTLVVVSGGSQGAARLDRAAAHLAGRWRDRGDVRMLIKARSDDAVRLADLLRENGGARVADVVGHIERMDLAYAAADAMVLRAGSATVAELEQLGTPAVLVPYPFAPGDHQSHNARALAATGQVVVVRDAELDADTLADALARLREQDPRRPAHPGTQPARRPAARTGLHAGAADAVARWALDLADQRRARLHLDRKDRR
jgi:UDP-N-acetylglucosamine--N-acetylmuramyl-(pentapeptide) pyrophosphoryl-undecaprenol N-acetylglucosamine transferase